MILTNQKQLVIRGRRLDRGALDSPERQLSAEEFLSLGQHNRQAPMPVRSTDDIDDETSEQLTTSREKVSSRRFKSRADADSWFAELELRAPLSGQVSLVREITKGKRGDECFLRMVVWAEIATTKTIRTKLTRRHTILHRDRASRRCSVARDASGSAISRLELVSFVKRLRADLEADHEYRWRVIISARLLESELGFFRNGIPFIVRRVTRRQKLGGTGYSVRLDKSLKERVEIPVIGITRDGWGCEPSDKRCVETRVVRHGQKLACQYDRRLADSGLQSRPILSSVAENPESWNSPIRHNRGALMPQAQFVELASNDTAEELAEFLYDRIPSRDAASSAIGRRVLAEQIADSLSRGNSVRRAASICHVPESSLRAWLGEFGALIG